MIAKSDIVILVLASSALAISLLRWSATTPSTAAAYPATTQQRSASREQSQREQPSVAGNAQTGNTADGASSGTSGDTGSDVPSGSTNTGGVSGDQAAPDVGQSGDKAAGGSAATEESPGDTATYTVVSGDSLGAIAERYDTSVLELQVINGIEGTTIYVGQTLRYPLTNDR